MVHHVISPLNSVGKGTSEAEKSEVGMRESFGANTAELDNGKTVAAFSIRTLRCTRKALLLPAPLVG